VKARPISERTAAQRSASFSAYLDLGVDVALADGRDLVRARPS